MVLRKADVLSAKNSSCPSAWPSLETVVAEEFHSLFAVATLQAIRAKSAGQMSMKRCSMPRAAVR